MKKLFEKYKHIWVLSYAFLYIPWFLYLERTVTNRYHVMHVALDDLIPFNEYFIVPYLLWFAYVAVTILFFFFTSREDYYRLCAFLFSGMTISLVICTFFKNGTDFRPVVDANKNLCSRLVAILYSADTSTNVFPSIHVYNSICTHIAICKSQVLAGHKWIKRGSFVLMISICLATVFLKQHSVIDGAGSTIMAYGMYWMVYGSREAAADKKAAQKALG